jgi:hypothetical protein
MRKYAATVTVEASKPISLRRAMQLACSFPRPDRATKNGAVIGRATRNRRWVISAMSPRRMKAASRFLKVMYGEKT